MGLKNKILNIYKKTVFTRKEEDSKVFYFRKENFPRLNSKAYAFKSSKGFILQGYFYYYTNINKQHLIIFDHGMGAGHYAYLREIELLAKEGYLVFAYDHTGCVESEGDSIGGFGQSLVDLDDAINCIETIEELKDYSVSVIGHSWGGYSTLNICALHPNIKSIIAISGFISVKEMIKQTFKFPFCFMRKSIYELESKSNPQFIDYNAINSLSNYQGKALIIHSDDDKTVSYNNNFLKMKKALKNNKNIEFLTVKGKNHNPNYSYEALRCKDAFFKDLQKNKQTIINEKSFKESYDWFKITEQDLSVWNIIFRVLENSVV